MTLIKHANSTHTSSISRRITPRSRVINRSSNVEFCKISANISSAFGTSPPITLAKYVVCSLDVYAFKCPPIFSISSSKSLTDLFSVPLNIICSKKCATPFVSSVSNLDPASIQTPTVAVCDARFDSVATRRPLGRVVTRVSG
ncbi:hypothetical protein HanRHA438_Chr08g0332991 [Helianthus annuus]|nr:hypothetical protein HanIR_Chr08g0347621 [Helianthus annuus]KAJ0896278.1 hypothetical protein HanRHA438_Chr08g0332991 [Helianthus annuus]